MKQRPIWTVFCTVVLTGLVLSGCGGASEAELLVSAKTYIDKRDFKGASIQLKNLLQKNPDSATARLMLGKVLLESGDVTSALVELRKAQSLDAPEEELVPELARAMVASGEHAKVLTQFGSLKLRGETAVADLATSIAAAHLLQGETNKTREALAMALQAKATYVPALMLGARLKVSEGEPDAALATLEDILARDPADERAGMLKGELLLGIKKDSPAALGAFKTVLAKHPESRVAQTAIVALLAQGGQLPEATTQFAQLKKMAPEHPDTLYFEAQLAFAQKDYKTVRDITDRILKVMPKNARVLELAGAAAFRTKAYSQAEAHLSQALKVAPGLLLSRQLLAQTMLQEGHAEKAIEVLQPILSSDKADAISLSLAGEAYLQVGDAQRSEAVFLRAAKAAPDNARVRTSVAMAQFDRGQAGPALAELEAIAAGDTGSRADLALISARLRQKDLAGALTAVEALQKKTPDKPLAYNLRGRIQLLQRNVPAATASFEAALSKDPNYFPAAASLAALELAADKPELARKRFNALLVAQPNNAQVLLALAELSARTGAPATEVARQLAEAVRLNPTEPVPRVLLISQLLSSGDDKAALVAAQNAAAALPGNQPILEALGRAQLASGDTQQAMSVFRQLIALQPKQALHHVRLAEAYVKARELPQATGSLMRALEIEPDLAIAKRTLANVAAMDKRPAEALAIAQQVQKSKPKEAEGFVLEGDIQASQGKWGLAAGAYRAATQRAKATETAIKLHQALLRSDKAADAERLATDWRKDRPQDAAFRYYLGDMALQSKDLPAAEGFYREVFALQPRNALAANNIAWLLVKQAKPGAVEMAEKANQLAPERAPLLDTLAAAQAADGQVTLAVQTQKKAIAVAPQDAALRLQLARLYLKSNENAFARSELDELARLGDKFAGQSEVAELRKQLR
jgi:cellulose synthase operon protein C